MKKIEQDTIWYANGIWHYKPSPKAMTRIYGTREALLIDWPKAKNKLAAVVAMEGGIPPWK